MGYLDDIAQMRAARQGRELADQLENMRRDHAENLRLRERAQVDGDTEMLGLFRPRSGAHRTGICARLPASSSRKSRNAIKEFVQEYAPFFDRHGATGMGRVEYRYRVRHHGQSFLAAAISADTGMGIPPRNAPEFKEAITNLFECTPKISACSFRAMKKC